MTKIKEDLKEIISKYNLTDYGSISPLQEENELVDELETYINKVREEILLDILDTIDLRLHERSVLEPMTSEIQNTYGINSKIVFLIGEIYKNEALKGIKTKVQYLQSIKEESK